MAGFRSWAAAVCAAAVVCALLRLLFPDTGLGRQGRLVLPCLFLLALLAPLPGLLSSVTLPELSVQDTVDATALEARLQQQVAGRLNDTLLDMVNQALAGYGWEAKKVVADMDISEEGSIHMGQITVYVDRETAERAVAVRQVAEKRLGTPVVLALWEETG